MSKILVCDKVRLLRDGDKVLKSDYKIVRRNVKLEDTFVEEFNKNWETGAQMYVINKAETKKRNDKLAAKNAPVENKIEELKPEVIETK